MRIKSAIRHINVLNLLLMGVIYILTNYYLLPAFREKTNLPQTAAKMGPPQQIDLEVPRFSLPPLHPAEEYLIVSDQNLFHPERKIPAAIKNVQLAEKPEFMLYGTLITDTVGIAFMEDRKVVYSSPGRGKRQQTVMLGKSLSNYTLTEIYHDRVLMVRGEDRIEVKISDSRTLRGQTVQVTVAPALE